MLLVHHVVTAAQLQRVDDVAPPARHLAHVARRGALPAGEVGLAEDRELQVGGDEALADQRRRHEDDAALRLLPQLGDHARRRVLGGQLLDHALGRAVPLRGEQQPPARALQRLDVVQRPLQVAAVGLDVARPDRERRDAVHLGLGLGALVAARVERERRERPPAQPAAGGDVAHLRERLERRRGQVDRRGAAGDGARPGGGEELLSGRDEVVRATAYPLGLVDDEQRVVGHQLEHRHHAVHEHGGERLHALDGDARGELVEHLDRAGQALHKAGGALPDRVGEQDLAARRGPQALLRDLERTLVGDGEPADLRHLVAPELETQRVVLGGREDVEDAAADGELATALHHVHARVRRGDEAVGHVREVRRAAGVQLDRLELAQTLDHRLQQRAGRHDEQPDRAGEPRLGRRVREAPEHRQPLGHRVRAGRQPLVRQRLPRGQDGDVVGPVVGQVRPDGRGELVGFAPRGGDDDERPPRGRRRQQRRAHTDRPDDVREPARRDVLERGGGAGVGEECGDDAGEVHAGPSGEVCGAIESWPGLGSACGHDDRPSSPRDARGSGGRASSDVPPRGGAVVRRRDREPCDRQGAGRAAPDYADPPTSPSTRAPLRRTGG